MTMQHNKVIMPSAMSSMNLTQWVDAIVQLDAAGWPMILLGSSDSKDPIDGLALAAFCAAKTEEIGVCAAIDPETVEPFTLARGLAALDHLSQGRAAWYLARAGDPKRTAELVDVTRQLLKSWDVDAIVDDIAGGLMSKPGSVHAINYEGEYFTVEGPLNTPQPPQGAVPLIFTPASAIANVDADVILQDENIIRCPLNELDKLLTESTGKRRHGYLRDRLEAML